MTSKNFDRFVKGRCLFTASKIALSIKYAVGELFKYWLNLRASGIVEVKKNVDLLHLWKIQNGV